MPFGVPRQRWALIRAGEIAEAQALSHADDPDDILRDSSQEPEPEPAEAATAPVLYDLEPADSEAATANFLYDLEPTESEAATVLDWPVPEEPEDLIPEEPEASSQDEGGTDIGGLIRQGWMADIMNDYSPSSTPHAWLPSSCVGPSSDSSLSPDTSAFVYRNDPTIRTSLATSKAKALSQAKARVRNQAKALSQPKARVRNQAKAKASRAKYLANGKDKKPRASRAKAKTTPKSEPRKRCRYKQAA